MRNLNKLFFIASSIASLLINNVLADNESTTTNNETTQEAIQNERYYMVFIKTDTNNTRKKRDGTPIMNTAEFINNAVSEIHSLIIENKDTYIDTEKFEALEETQKLRKRNNNRKRTIVEQNDNVGSAYVYPISSVEDSTVLYAYLNENIVPQITEIDYVSSVHIGEHFDLNAAENDTETSYYDIEYIKKETGWKEVSVRKDAYDHLSLISQAQSDENIVPSYDSNFYYPSSAGKDIDIVIMDVGFNFNSPEFSNTLDRTVKCMIEIKNATAHDVADESICGRHSDSSYHGELVSDMAGGLTAGVAVKSNIYGVALNYDNVDKLLEEDIFAGIQFIIDNMVRPHKTVVSISSGKFYRISNPGDNGKHYQMLINQLIEKGAIVVSSAGNQGALTYNVKKDYQYLPCSINGVICVGGVDTFYTVETRTYPLYYRSNSGATVNLYAPFTVYGNYRDEKGDDIENIVVYGTSFSTPLVSGVAASIMAENSDVNFDSYSMADYLARIAQKDIVSDLDPDTDHNLFINNGKMVVYATDGVYHGCGFRSGNLLCTSELYHNCDEDSGYCLNDNGFSIFEEEKEDPVRPTDSEETSWFFEDPYENEDPVRPPGFIGYVNGEPVYEEDENANNVNIKPINEHGPVTTGNDDYDFTKIIEGPDPADPTPTESASQSHQELELDPVPTTNEEEKNNEKPNPKIDIIKDNKLDNKNKKTSKTTITKTTTITHTTTKTMQPVIPPATTKQPFIPESKQTPSNTDTKQPITEDTKQTSTSTPTPIVDHVKITKTTNPLPINDVFKMWGNQIKSFFNKNNHQ